MWLYEDVTIPTQTGTCGDGQVVQPVAQTFPVTRLDASAVDNYSKHLTNLHTLVHSNLADIDTQCETWSELVKLRCTELITRSPTLASAHNSTAEQVAVLQPAPSRVGEIASLKTYLEILFYFERMQLHSTSADPTLGNANLAISAATSSTAPIYASSGAPSKFSICIRWCIQYLASTLLNCGNGDDLNWLLSQMRHTRDISSWGCNLLQIPPALKSNSQAPLDQRLQAARTFLVSLQSALSPVLTIPVPTGASPSLNLSTINSKPPVDTSKIAQPPALNAFVLSEMDFIGLMSQFSLSIVMQSLATSTLQSVRSATPSSDQSMNIISTVAPTMSVLEDTLHIVSSAIPLIISNHDDLAKKLADMLVKCANTALRLAADILCDPVPDDVAVLIKSKAEQLLYRSFLTLLRNPSLWQFLVHLNLVHVSAESVFCMLSSLYYDNPTRISFAQTTFESWESEIKANPSMRNTMVSRLSENTTSSYFVYFLVGMARTHLNHAKIVKIILFELFSLAYSVPATASMQKEIRDQLSPLIGRSAPLISFLIYLTDSHINRLLHGCFHPWNSVPLDQYELPEEDIATLKRWFLAPETSTAHYLARYIIASIHTGYNSENAFNPSEIKASVVHQRLAHLVLEVGMEFANPSVPHSRSSSFVSSFSSFCCTILLRTFHVDYRSLCALGNKFYEPVVISCAKAFTKSVSSSGVCNIDPVTAFGIIELTGLAGSYVRGAHLDGQFWSPSSDPISPSSTTFDLCIRSFFDCGVPVLSSLAAASNPLHQAVCSRLLFDLTTQIAPFVCTIASFSSPEWTQSPFYTSTVAFANNVLLPFLQLPSLFGIMASSVVSLVRGSSNAAPLASSSSSSSSSLSTSTPTSSDNTTKQEPNSSQLTMLILAQYSLCRQADNEASSFSNGLNSADHGQSPASHLYAELRESTGFHFASTAPEAIPRTASTLTFWLKSLMSIRDWYLTPQVLDIVEAVLQLVHASNIFELAVTLAGQAERQVLEVASKRPQTTPGQLPIVLTALLGSITKEKGLLSSLFSSTAACSISHPWTVAVFMQSFVSSINFVDIGGAASTAVAPGQSAPNNVGALRTALAPLQPVFEATVKSLLCLEPSRPASFAIWNIFAQLYFANCNVNGQTLFFGQYLFLTSPQKTHMQKIRARVSHFVNYLKSSPSNASNDAPLYEDEFRTNIRELFSSLDNWLKLDLFRYTTMQSIVSAVPMGQWLSIALESPPSNFWLAKAPRQIPNALQQISAWTFFLLKPSKEPIKVDVYIPNTKTTVNLMEILHNPALGRQDALQRLRSERRALLNQESDASEANDKLWDSSSGLKISEIEKLAPFDLNDALSVSEIKSALKELQELSIMSYNRKKSHWDALDRRLVLLQSLKSNAPQIATARATCRLAEKCQAPVEFRVQISSIANDPNCEKELATNLELCQRMIHLSTGRNLEAIANRHVVRFLLTMYSLFGHLEIDKESAAAESASSSSRPDTRGFSFKESDLTKIIEFFWMLRNSHSAIAGEYPPLVQIFNFLERQLLQCIVNDPSQVGPTLYAIVEDSWSAANLSDYWKPDAAQDKFQLLQYLWTQPLPLLEPQYRAKLLLSFSPDTIADEMSTNEDAKKDITTKIITMLQSQILWRAGPRMSPQHMASIDFQAITVHDVLYDVAIRQLTAMASSNFPANLAPILQFTFDESRNRTIHPSSWNVVLDLPFLPGQGNSGSQPGNGLSPQKLTSILQFTSSYLSMFKQNNISNYLALWAPYIPKLMSFLGKLGLVLARHIHMQPSRSNSEQSLALSPTSSNRFDPDSPPTGDTEPPRSSTPTPPSSPSPSTPVMSPSSSYGSIPAGYLDTSVLSMFLGLYSLWIGSSSPDSQTLEIWDPEVEQVAAFVAQSLQKTMYSLLPSPFALTSPEQVPTGRYNLDTLSNPQFASMLSPRSLSILSAVLDWFFGLFGPEWTQQRAKIWERTPFANLPFMLFMGSRPLLVSKLNAMRKLMVTLRDQPVLLRLVHRVFMNFWPVLSSPSAPAQNSPVIDGEILAMIIDTCISAMTYLPLPYENDECTFWTLLTTVMPWDRMAGQRFLRSDFSSLLDARGKQREVENLQSPLRQLADKGKAFCDSMRLYFIATSGYDVSKPPPPHEVSKVGDTDRVLYALWFLRRLCHLPSSVNPNTTPNVISIQGLMAFHPPVADDWKSAEKALRMGQLVEATFAAHALLLAPTTSLRDAKIWCKSPGQAYAYFFGPMLRYLAEVQAILNAIASRPESAPPISPNVRDFLMNSYGVPQHMPDSVAYAVLFANISGAIATSIFSCFNQFDLVSRQRFQPSTSTVSSSSSSSSAPDSAELWEESIIETALAQFRDVPLLAPVCIRVIMSNIPRPNVASALIEGLLQSDWHAIRSTSVIADLLVFPGPNASHIDSSASLDRSSSSQLAFTPAQFRQAAFKGNCQVTLLAVCRKALIKALPSLYQSQENQNALISSSSGQQNSIQAPPVQSALQLEPEFHHWATHIEIQPNREYQTFALWSEIVQIYVVLILSKASEVQDIIGSHHKTNFAAKLFKVAQHIQAQTKDTVESSSAMLRFIGVKSSSGLPAPFRIASQLLSLFVLEHLLDVPVLGAGNKVVATNVTVLNHSTLTSLAAVEQQIKRKELLAKSAAPKQPNAQYSQLIANVIEFISRPQKSLKDITEVISLIAPVFGPNITHLLLPHLQKQ